MRYVLVLHVELTVVSFNLGRLIDLSLFERHFPAENGFNLLAYYSVNMQDTGRTTEIIEAVISSLIDCLELIFSPSLSRKDLQN